jgi:hypothetical protein
MTMLRAAGVPDTNMELVERGPEELGRDDEVGVPDASAGLGGLRSDDPAPEAGVALRITGIDQARVGADELIGLIEDAGGRTD